MAQTLIKAQNLTKRYDMGGSMLYALDDISITIDEGDFVAIFGPSGSGKSTLMNLIGGLDKPQIGTITVGGKDLSHLNDKEISAYRNKTVGFVFQNFNLNGGQTALENVIQPLVYAGIKRSQRQEIASMALQSVGLEDRINHKPAELSGGQRQRVSIARAIVNRPQIILADEPTGNLDSRSGKMVMELLSRLNDEGYTIIMITHNPKQALMAKRTIEIKDGKITNDQRQDINE